MTQTQPSYHYGLIARAIAELDAAEAPLSLQDLAARMGMSEAHFQRLFSQWAGVSPKRYQQYLALGQAREMLARHATTLETADAVGLSGSGRLHDLFVTWEAMSPGDYAKGGEGLTLSYAWCDSPFGEAIVMATERGICGLGFAAELGREGAFEDLRRRWPKAAYREDAALIAPLAARAFGRDPEANAKTPLFLIGAPFQLQVWEALLAIPDGQVTTYGDIARFIGNPKAVRAVGTAIGRNPVALLIPCHRALRKGGALGGYHWGLPLKRAILAREAARAEAMQPLSR